VGRGVPASLQLVRAATASSAACSPTARRGCPVPALAVHTAPAAPAAATATPSPSPATPASPPAPAKVGRLRDFHVHQRPVQHGRKRVLHQSGNSELHSVEPVAVVRDREQETASGRKEQ